MKMVNDGRLKGQTRWPRCASRSARYWRAFENKERARKQKVDNHSKMEGIPRRGNQHVESALFSFMTGKIPVVVLMDVLLDQLHMTDHLNIISKQKAKKQNEENENWFIISQRWDKNICITQRHHHPFNHLFSWRGGAFFHFPRIWFTNHHQGQIIWPILRNSNQLQYPFVHLLIFQLGNKRFLSSTQSKSIAMAIPIWWLMQNERFEDRRHNGTWHRADWRTKWSSNSWSVRMNRQFHVDQSVWLSYCT